MQEQEIYKLEVKMTLSKEAYIRNHVMGVLCSYQEKGISMGNVAEMGTEIAQAAIEAYDRWNAEKMIAISRWAREPHQ